MIKFFFREDPQLKAITDYYPDNRKFIKNIWILKTFGFIWSLSILNYIILLFLVNPSLYTLICEREYYFRANSFVICVLLPQKLFESIFSSKSKNVERK